MKIIHITPTYFDDVSVIGGGERYPTELASCMSKFVDTTLVSFSSQRKSFKQGQLKCETYAVKNFIKGNKWALPNATPLNAGLPYVYFWNFHN